MLSVFAEGGTMAQQVALSPLCSRVPGLIDQAQVIVCVRFCMFSMGFLQVPCFSPTSQTYASRWISCS